ncbi:MAG: prepilin-type N-terminal cleavage/methylation domain-containing protein [Planctomycetota bacterium]
MTRPMRSGFTLVELLVVVAIIMVIIAFLFPVITQAREYAKRTVCISNLRQIGLCIGAYAGDNSLRLPGIYWYNGGMFTNDNLSALYPPSPIPSPIKILQCSCDPCGRLYCLEIEN